MLLSAVSLQSPCNAVQHTATLQFCVGVSVHGGTVFTLASCAALQFYAYLLGEGGAVPVETQSQMKRGFLF